MLNTSGIFIQIGKLNYRNNILMYTATGHNVKGTRDFLVKVCHFPEFRLFFLKTAQSVSSNILLGLYILHN